MQEKEFDVVILGGGPAGFSAGIYTARGNVRIGKLSCVYENWWF